MASKTKRGFLDKLLGRRKDKENVDYDTGRFDGYYGSNRSHRSFMDEESLRNQAGVLKPTSAYHTGRRTKQTRGPLSCPGGGLRADVPDYDSDDNQSFRTEFQKRSKRRKNRTPTETDEQAILSSWNMNERKFVPNDTEEYSWLQNRNELLQERLKQSKERITNAVDRYRQEKRRNKELEEKVRILTERCNHNEILIQTKNQVIQTLQNDLSTSFRQLTGSYYQHMPPMPLFNQAPIMDVGSFNPVLATSAASLGDSEVRNFRRNEPPERVLSDNSLGQTESLIEQPRSANEGKESLELISPPLAPIGNSGHRSI